MIAQVLSCSLILAFVSVPGFAQAGISASTQPAMAAKATAPAPPMPKDPKDLMLLAAQVNGLRGKDMKPWHLKANFQTFDTDGNPDRGVFEEWWAGPEEWKISYSSKGFNQVRYKNSKGLFMTGDTKSPPFTDSMVEWFLNHPLPPTSEIRRQDFGTRDTKDGAVALKCIIENPRVKTAIIPTYCFTKHVPAIRIEAVHGGFVAYFNKIARFDGQYSANELQVEFLGKPALKVHVTELESLAKIDDAIFALPVGAMAASPMPLVIAPKAFAKNRIFGIDPIYPPIAKAARISGEVGVAVTISAAGVVTKARVIYCPPMLCMAALDTVRTWKYKPYLVNGQPTEIRSDVQVIYTLY